MIEYSLQQYSTVLLYPHMGTSTVDVLPIVCHLQICGFMSLPATQQKNKQSTVHTVLRDWGISVCVSPKPMERIALYTELYCSEELDQP